jgi:hypothetical protein
MIHHFILPILDNVASSSSLDSYFTLLISIIGLILYKYIQCHMVASYRIHLLNCDQMNDTNNGCHHTQYHALINDGSIDNNKLLCEPPFLTHMLSLPPIAEQQTNHV